MDKSLLQVVTTLITSSHTLSFSLLQNSRRRKEITRALKTRENPYNSLKNTSSSLQASPLFLAEALGVYLQAPEDEAPKSRPLDQIAGSMARFLPRIRGHSRVSAAESWPLRQQILLPFCQSLLATLDLLEGWEYAWTTPDLGLTFGLFFWLLINPFNP